MTFDSGETKLLASGTKLENVPENIQEDASKAIEKILRLRTQETLRPGLYYIVFTDMYQSTALSELLSPEETISRLDKFIELTKKASNDIKVNNVIWYIKRIGDGSLFLFDNFADILNWIIELDGMLDEQNLEYKKQNKSEDYLLKTKTLVHLGEVHFNIVADPIALAINQIFTIEKIFGNTPIGITDAVKQVILPRINSNQISVEKICDETLPGEDVSRPLWNVTIKNFKS